MRLPLQITEPSWAGIGERVPDPAGCVREHSQQSEHWLGSAEKWAAHVNGATLTRARLDKARKYAELVDGDRCHLVVVGIETGAMEPGSARFRQLTGSCQGTGRASDSSVQLTWHGKKDG